MPLRLGNVTFRALLGGLLIEAGKARNRIGAGRHIN
jgi:hypothetical protein